MNEPRCPDCGFRLKTNECPICCKRVPFPAVRKAAPVQPAGKRKVSVSLPKKASRGNSTPAPKMKILWAVLAAVLAFMPALGELWEDISPPQPEFRDTAYYEDYLAAGSEGAQDMPVIEQQILYQDENVQIIADSMGLLYDAPVLMATVSNTSEMDLDVSVGSVAVNGYMMNSAGLYEEVPAWETVQTYLWMDSQELQDAGIETIGDMELQLDIFDADDYTSVVSGQRVSLQTSAAGLVQPVDDSGRTVYEKGGIRLVFRDAQVDEYGDAKIRFFAENLTGDTVYIGTDSFAVNGGETDAMLWCCLWPGTRAISPVYIFEVSQYDIGGTSDLRQLQLELFVESVESWQREMETIVIDVNM